MNRQSQLDSKTWKKFYKKNNYYHTDNSNLLMKLIPQDVSVLEIGCKGGEFLHKLKNKVKKGVVIQEKLFDSTKKLLNKNETELFDDFLKNKSKEKFDYIVLSHALSEVDDAQNLIKIIRDKTNDDSRIIVTYFNFLWKPVLDVAEQLGLRLPQTKEPNWWTEGDVDNLFYLEDFEKVKSGKRFLFPFNIPFISTFFNRYLAQLPVFNYFTLTNYTIYRPTPKIKEYSVSIIIPARNEAGNMKNVLSKIPNLGMETEVVFVEGHSKDNTFESIEEEIKRYKGPIKTKLFKQKGKGKGDAVRLGFSKASNELLMILDADLTVDPKELPKFYKAIAVGKGELIMGSRLIYPMEAQAMRLLNYLGNKFFSLAFSFLLSQRIKDTLCGTKVLLKSDYYKIEKNRYVFGDFDPFGDYDLIFGAANLNLKITEIPIRYKERTYGSTNISRFRHGLLLFKMVFFAAKNLKFI